MTTVGAGGKSYSSSSNTMGKLQWMNDDESDDDIFYDHNGDTDSSSLFNTAAIIQRNNTNNNVDILTNHNNADNNHNDDDDDKEKEEALNWLFSSNDDDHHHHNDTTTNAEEEYDIEFSSSNNIGKGFDAISVLTRDDTITNNDVSSSSRRFETNNNQANNNSNNNKDTHSKNTMLTDPVPTSSSDTTKSDDNPNGTTTTTTSIERRRRRRARPKKKRSNKDKCAFYWAPSWIKCFIMILLIIIFTCVMILIIGSVLLNNQDNNNNDDSEEMEKQNGGSHFHSSSDGDSSIINNNNNEDSPLTKPSIVSSSEPPSTFVETTTTTMPPNPPMLQTVGPTTTTPEDPTTTTTTTPQTGPVVVPPSPSPFSIYFVRTASEIRSTMRIVQPGDTILMITEDEDDDGTNNAWIDQDIVFRASGTVDHPITLRPADGSGIMLSGTSRLRLSGKHLIVNGLRFEEGALEESGKHVIEFRTSSTELCHYCRLTNTAIMDYNPSTNNLDYRWVGIYGTNNRIDHCYFSGKNHQGPMMIIWRGGEGNDDDDEDDAQQEEEEKDSYHRIDHNYFGDLYSGSTTVRRETIRFGGNADDGSSSKSSSSSSGIIIEQNLFLRCNGNPDLITIKSSNSILRGNTFVNYDGIGVTLRHGRNNTVDGNFFLGGTRAAAATGTTTTAAAADSGGIRIMDSDHIIMNNYMEGLKGSSSKASIVLSNGVLLAKNSNNNNNKDYSPPVERVTIAFNTIYHCQEAIRIGWKSSTYTVEVRDSVIANNIIVSTSGASRIVREEATPTNMQYEGNYMYSDDNDGVSLGLSPTPIGINEVDPKLVLDDDDYYYSSNTLNLYRPSSDGSPCINGAQGSYPFVVSDMDGQPRSTLYKDVGADEVVVGVSSQNNNGPNRILSRPFSANDVGVIIGPSWWLL